MEDSAIWYSGSLNMWLLLAVVLISMYWCSQSHLSYWAIRRVPFLEPHWFFGNFEKFIKGDKSLTEATVDIYNDLGGERFGGIWQMLTPIFFVKDPDLLREMMVNDFNVWATRGIAANFDVDPLSAHLVNLEGKKWRSVRAKLTPTFTSGKLKKMQYLLLECGKDLEKYLSTVSESGEPVDAKEMAAKFTTDVIGTCVFGIQMNALSAGDTVFRVMGRNIFRLTFRKKMIRVFQTSFPRMFRLLKLASIDEETTEFFLKIVRESFDYREKNNIQRHDFIDLLRELKNTNEPVAEDEVVFDDKLLAAQAFVFFAAGFETSSSAISYCLHELAVNQDIQDRLREEIHATVAANNGDISWDTLKNMKYLDMVVQETLRKHPPITVSTRKSVKSYRVPGTDIFLSSGTTCILPIYALHHDEKYFPDPEKFDPERFADEAENIRSAPYFIPFGNGPRACIGSRFAVQQVKLGLFKTIENFNVSLCEESEDPLQHSPEARFLAPKNGIWLCITRYSPN